MRLLDVDQCYRCDLWHAIVHQSVGDGYAKASDRIDGAALAPRQSREGYEKDRYRIISEHVTAEACQQAGDAARKKTKSDKQAVGGSEAKIAGKLCYISV